MRQCLKHLLPGLVFCATALPMSVAFAESANVTAAMQGEASLIAEPGQTLSDESLIRQSGRQDTKIDQLNVTDMTNNAQMNSNTISNVGSTMNNGANTIAQNAFANANGLVTVIQNSGNQVLIKNDMLLNLYMK